jgi:hypothetical protein
VWVDREKETGKAREGYGLMCIESRKQQKVVWTGGWRKRWNGWVVYGYCTDRRKDGEEWAGGEMDVSLCGWNMWMEARKNQ